MFMRSNITSIEKFREERRNSKVRKMDFISILRYQMSFGKKARRASSCDPSNSFEKKKVVQLMHIYWYNYLCRINHCLNHSFYIFKKKRLQPPSHGEII